MAASDDQALIPINLPLMYVDPHRTLATVTAYLDDLSVLDRLRSEARGSGDASAIHSAASPYSRRAELTWERAAYW